MFGKLGQVLQKGIDKIASAVFVDKELIDSIVKDLQRALIEADVNVLLVKEISEKIRKAAIDERVKGIEKKEHIIKLLHDELKRILGGEKRELQLKKGDKIMLLGLFGAGKCVHKDTKIQISTGEIIKAEELYRRYSHLQKEELIYGEAINIENENLHVPSFNPKTGKIENKLATHLWKLNKKEIYEIKLDNGNDFSIKVTPEHPFFVLRNGKIIQVRADELTERDYISLPEKINIQGMPQSITEKLKKLDLDVYLSPEEVKTIMKRSVIKTVQKSLVCKRNYSQFTMSLKKGIIPIELVDLNKFSNIRTKLKDAAKIISIPLTISSEFAEFLGYLMGDGHIGKNYVEIVSEDSEVIERVNYLGRYLFNLPPKISRDLRTNKMFKISLASKTLVKILEVFKLRCGKKGRNLEIPEEVLKSDSEVTRSFIKSYFDCDGSPSQKSRQIELTSESKILIAQMSFLLKRYAIFSSISSKKVNGKEYYRMSVSGRSSERYAERIGSIIAHKKERMGKFKMYGDVQGSGKKEMVPAGNCLKRIRELGGFSIGEIQKEVNSYGRYEEFGFISREQLIKLILFYEKQKLGIFPKILRKLMTNERINCGILNGMTLHLKRLGFINENLSLTSIGNKYLNEISQEIFLQELDSLKILAFSDVRWVKLNSLNKIENDSEYVYDLTVDDNHSFIADNFIVHNTTTISKLSSYYAKRGFKTAALGLDVHRPAAAEQLEQLGKKNNFPAFIDKKEKNPLKIYEKFKPELEKYDLIFIDTAGRDAMDNELIKEIKAIGKKLNPQHIILIMPADIGQAAKKQASEFQKALNINGVIITRMDSTAKGGGALTACSETNAPVFFITTGEHVNDIETFSPEQFISRMLGMGDLNALLEKVQSVVDEKKQGKLKERLAEGKFTMLDLYEQLKSMEGLGSLSKLKNLIPGLGNAKIPDSMLESQEGKLKKFKFAIQSMTKEEIENPEIIEKQTSRMSRIAKGAGVNTGDVRALLKQYRLIKDFAKSGIASGDLSQGFSEKQMQKLAKKFGKRIRM